MNFVFLASKYLGVDCLCEDRSYGGLIWPKSEGDKPSYEIFEAFQRQEDHAKRVGVHDSELKLNERRELHHQAKARALEDIIPYGERVLAEHAEIRRQTFEQKAEAVRLKHSLETRQHVLESWQEITAAEDVVSKEAQTYLEDTAHMLSWDPHKIPAEVLARREEAHKRVEHCKTVYAKWQELRANELPTREEMAAAIRAGGEELARLKKICHDAAIKFPRPRRHHY